MQLNLLRRLILVLFFTSFALAGSTQSGVKPSAAELTQVLSATQQDTHRVKALLDLGGYYLFKPLELTIDLDSAMPYLQEAKKLSAQLADDTWQKESLWHIAYCYFERKDPVHAMQTAEELTYLYRQTEGKLAEADAWAKLGSLILRHKDNLEAVIQCNEKARAIYDDLGEKKRSIDMYKEIADMHLNQGKLAQSEEELLEVIKMYEAIGFLNLHYSYDLLAAVCINRGNLNRALNYGMKAIKSMEATQDTVADHAFYYKLGTIYWQLDNMKEATYWYFKSVENLPNKRYSLRTLLAQGMIRLGQVQKAKDFLDETMKHVPPQTASDSSYMALGYALVYNALGQYRLAEKSFQESIRLQRLYDNLSLTSSRSHFEFGKFLIERKRFEEASTHLNIVLSLSDGILDVKRQRDAHELLIRVDSARGQFLDALYHFRKFQLLNDSLYTTEKNRQVEELHIQYQTEAKERDIQLLQNEAQLQTSRLGQAKLTKNLMIAGAAILLFILGLLFSRYRIKQRTNRLLEIQQMDINQTNKRLQMLVDEKELLLREIHHRVKNNLQIVMSLLNTQSSFLDNGTALTAIRQSQHRIHSISLIHQKLYQSNSLARIEMSDYIHELIDYLKDCFDTNHRISFVTKLEIVHLDVTQAVPLGLILNEAISNAIKYAFPNGRTGVINIDLHQQAEDQYVLTIADDGIGWPQGFMPGESKTLGMSLMKGLSKQLNGHIQVENKNGLNIWLTFLADKINQHESHADSMLSSL